MMTTATQGIPPQGIRRGADGESSPDRAAGYITVHAATPRGVYGQRSGDGGGAGRAWGNEDGRGASGGGGGVDGRKHANAYAVTPESPTGGRRIKRSSTGVSSFAAPLWEPEPKRRRGEERQPCQVEHTIPVPIPFTIHGRCFFLFSLTISRCSFLTLLAYWSLFI